MKFVLPTATIFLLVIAACSEQEQFISFKNSEKLENLEQTYQEYTKHYADPVLAYNLLESIKVQAEELRNEEYLAKYYIGYGYLKKMDKHLDEAVTAFFNALLLYQHTGDSLFQAKVLNNIGDIYRVANLHEEALHYFQEAESLYIHIGRRDKLAGLYQNIGLIFLDSSSFQIAGEYFNNGMQISRDNNLSQFIHQYHNLFGELYLKRGEYKKARDSYFSALDLVEKDNQLMTAYIYGNIGETYLKEDKVEMAETWFSKSLGLKQSIDKVDLRPTLNYLGEVEIKKGNLKKALSYFDKVVDLSKDDIINKQLDIALENIQTIYEDSPHMRSEQDFENSLHYLGVARESKKVLDEVQSKLNNLYAQYSVRKGYNEFVYQTNLKNEQDEKYNSMLAAGFLLLSCLILIAAIVIYRKNLKITAQNLKATKENLKTTTENYKLSKTQVDSVRQTLIESGYSLD